MKPQRMTAGQVPAIHAMLKRVLKPFPWNEAEFRAKYGPGVGGRESWAFAVWEGQRPIAFAGAVPQYLGIQGRKALVGHLGDSVVEENYRGQGLYQEIEAALRVVLGEEGGEMLWAFQSAQTHRALHKIGWQDMATCQGLKMPSGSSPLARLRNRVQPKDLLVRRFLRLVEPILEKGPTPEHPYQNSPCHAEYGEEWRGHKAQYSPSRIVRIGECRFWLKPSRSLFVGATWYPHQEALLESLQGLRMLARRMGVAQIIFLESQQSPLLQDLQGQGESFDAWTISGKGLASDPEPQGGQFTYADTDSW